MHTMLVTKVNTVKGLLNRVHNIRVSTRDADIIENNDEEDRLNLSKI